MAQQKNTRLEKHQLDAIQDMVERGQADNESEAHRMLLNAGKREFGYKNGGCSQTTLRTMTHEMAKVFLVAGLALVGVTYFYPVSLRLMAIGPIVSGLFLLGVERILADVEPNVSNKIRGLFGGESV